MVHFFVDIKLYTYIDTDWIRVLLYFQLLQKLKGLNIKMSGVDKNICRPPQLHRSLNISKGAFSQGPTPCISARFDQSRHTRLSIYLMCVTLTYDANKRLILQDNLAG